MRTFITLTIALCLIFIVNAINSSTIKDVVDSFPDKPTIRKYCADGKKVLIIENDKGITAVVIGECDIEEKENKNEI